MGEQDESPRNGQIVVVKSILKRAMANDSEALATMFHQFIPNDENIQFSEYLGVEGMWGIGRRSFACVTTRRIASLKIGAFKEVVYQDGYLEHTNSGIIYQPSKLLMYILMVVVTCLAVYLSSTLYTYMNFAQIMNQGEQTRMPLIFAIIVGLVLLPLFWLFSVRLFYRFNKCGLVWWIREGVAVYIFANRGKLLRANHLYRLCTRLRDERIKTVREPI